MHFLELILLKKIRSQIYGKHSQFKSPQNNQSIFQVVWIKRILAKEIFNRSK